MRRGISPPQELWKPKQCRPRRRHRCCWHRWFQKRVTRDRDRPSDCRCLRRSCNHGCRRYNHCCRHQRCALTIEFSLVSPNVRSQIWDRVVNTCIDDSDLDIWGARLNHPCLHRADIDARNPRTSGVPSFGFAGVNCPVLFMPQRSPSARVVWCAGESLDAVDVVRSAYSATGAA